MTGEDIEPDPGYAPGIPKPMSSITIYLREEK
jgi:hypothetical protein